QLGVCPARQPDPDRLRHRLQGSVVLLWTIAALLYRLCPDPRFAGSAALSAGGQLRPAASQATAAPCDRRRGGAGGVGGVPDDVVDSSRVVVARRCRAAAEPGSRGGGAAGPESLDRLGTALCRARRPVAGGAGPIVLLPGTGLEQWTVLLRADGLAGATAIPARLQPPDNGRHPAQALRGALA